MNKKKKRVIFVILFMIVLIIAAYINIRGSYLEYKELGENYLSVFFTNLKYKYTIMGINFVVLYIVMYFANRGIKKGLKEFFKEEKKETPKLPNKSISLIMASIASIVIATLFTPKVILYASNVSFGEVDTVFNLDISFYMFVEPLLKMTVLYVIAIFIGLIVYSVIYSIIVFNKYFDGVDRETLRRSYLIKHIIRYIRFIAIGFAIYTLIRTLDIVFDKFITTDSGIELIGAGIINVRIRLWANILFALVIVVAIFRATINWKKRTNSKVIKDILAVPGYLVVMFVVMIVFDVILVKPNEYDKERKYIESNIYSTKTAYGIDCEDETIEYSGTINEKEINLTAKEF
ncbi:MAG: COG1615 family transporter, partial [Clostridia bacterium]|nr:COG1615 family transporter [Clostridia bacterium]